MDSIAIEIVKIGLQPSVQDHGRPGLQHLGVPCGGALDKRSAYLANWLVGNVETMPVLEIPLVGPLLKFHGDAIIALTGADMQACVNDERVDINKTLKVRAGTSLSFGKLIDGCRAYLAVQGNWLLNTWLNSCSAALGVVQSQNDLRKGDLINIEKTAWIEEFRSVQADSSKRDTYGFYPGPEWDILSTDEQHNLSQGQFTIGIDSNRMGYRLEPVFKWKEYRQIISSPVMPGVIQLTPSGQLIILMADAQTIGGYPRIGLIPHRQLDALAQKKPGDILRLEIL